MDHNNGLQKVSNLKTPIMDPRPQKVHHGIVGHALSGIREEYRSFTVLSFLSSNAFFTLFFICFAWPQIICLEAYNPFSHAWTHLILVYCSCLFDIA